MSSVAVYPDGKVVRRDGRGRISRSDIPRASLARIRAVVDAEVLARELVNLTLRSQPFADHEEVWIVIERNEYRFVCGEVKPTPHVVESIRKVEQLLRLKIVTNVSAAARCM
jgi:hypothetical protein